MTFKPWHEYNVIPFDAIIKDPNSMDLVKYECLML